MSTQPAKRLDFFERFLSLWVLACMLVGVAAGKLLPGVTATLSDWEFGRESHVNIPIAVLIWLMVYPMMLKIDFGGLAGVVQRPRGLFGPTSGAALATIVGVLVEVPVMLSVCRVCNTSRNWYQRSSPMVSDAAQRPV